MGQQGIPPGNLYFLLSLTQRRATGAPPANGDEPPKDEPDYLLWFVLGTGLASAIGVAIVLVCA